MRVSELDFCAWVSPGLGQQQQTAPMRQQGHGEGPTLTPLRATPDAADYAGRQGPFPVPAGSYRPAMQHQQGAPRPAGAVRPPPLRRGGPPQPSVSIVLSPRPPAPAKMAAPQSQPMPGMISAPTITSSAAYQGHPRPQQPPVGTMPRGLPVLLQRGGPWTAPGGPVQPPRPAGGARPFAGAGLAPAGPPGTQPELRPSQQQAQHAGSFPQQPSLPGSSDQLRTGAHDKALSATPMTAQLLQQQQQQQQAAGVPNGAVKDEQ